MPVHKKEITSNENVLCCQSVRAMIIERIAANKLALLNQGLKVVVIFSWYFFFIELLNNIYRLIGIIPIFQKNKR